MKETQEETQKTKDSATQTIAISCQGSATSPMVFSLFNPAWQLNGSVPVAVGEHILGYLDANSLGLTTPRINKAWKALTEEYLKNHPQIQKEVEKEKAKQKVEAKRKKEEERQARKECQQSYKTAKEIFESAELRANVLLSLSSMSSVSSQLEQKKEREEIVLMLYEAEAHLTGKVNQFTFKGALQVATKLSEEEKYIAWMQGFELLGDIYQQRGILEEDERQLLKAVTLYNLALCSQERYKELASRSSEKDTDIRKSCIVKIQGIEEYLITRYQGQVIKQTEESYWQVTEKAKQALKEIRQRSLGEIPVKQIKSQANLSREVKGRKVIEAIALPSKNDDSEGEKKQTATEEKEKIEQENKIETENSDLSIQSVYQHIAQGIKKAVVKPLIGVCQASLPMPEGCVYSINFLGSIARSEATPYSDFECAVLIEDQGEEKNKLHKTYIRHLIILLWIKVLNLGETTARMMDITSLKWLSEQESPVRKGFSFDGQMEDGCHTPLGNVHHIVEKIKKINEDKKLTEEEKEGERKNVYESEYELIGTPKELARFQEERWVHKRGFSTVLSTVEPIVSNDGYLEKNLTQSYEEEMEKIWNQPVEGTDKTLIQKRSLDFLAESTERFKFKGGRFDKEEHYFDVKYHFYRLPNMLLDHLASYFGVKAKNLWDKIEDLFGERGVVTNKSADINLKDAVSDILWLRLFAYLKKGYRDDHVIMFDFTHPKKNQTLLAQCLGIHQESLFQIYSVLIPLQRTVEQFTKQKGSFQVLLQNTFYDNTPFVRGYIYDLLLDYEQAAKAYEKAKRIYIEAYGSQHVSVAEALHNLGMVYEAQGRYAEAIRTYEEANRIFIKVHGSQHVLVGETLNSLGNVYQAQGRYAEAIRAYEEAKCIEIAVHGSQHVSVANTLNNLGGVYQVQGRYTEAIRTYEEANRIFIKVHGPQHILVAKALGNLGNVYEAQDRYTEAMRAYEEVKRIYIEVHGHQHTLVAQILNNLGIVYKAQGHYTEAIRAYEEAIRIFIKVHGSQHVLMADTLNSLGNVYQSQGRYAEAIRAYEEAKRIYIEVYGPQQVSVARTVNNLGQIYQDQGHDAEAIKAYKEAKRIFIEVHGPQHELVAHSLSNLGNVYKIQGHYAKAMRALEEAKHIEMAVHGPQHTSVADTLNSLGIVYEDQGRYAEAIRAYEEAIRIFIKVHGPQHISVAQTLNNLGGVYQDQGRYAEAIRVYEEVKRIFIEVHGSQHVSVANTLNNLGLVYVGLKQFDQARTYYMQALAICEYSESSSKEKIEGNLRRSYLREGNDLLLKEPMNIEVARACYQQSGSAIDCTQPEAHQNLAEQAYRANNLRAAREHTQILIKLDLMHSSAYHNLGCYTHIQAQIEKDKGDEAAYRAYLTEAEGYFKIAITLEPHAGIYTEYAQFMMRNHLQYPMSKAIDALQKVITLKQEDRRLNYGVMERSTMDLHLQSLIDEHKEIRFRAYLLAYYLLIQAYLINDQFREANQTFNTFEAAVVQLKQANEKRIAKLVNNMETVIPALSKGEVQEMLQQLHLQQQAMDKEHQLLDALLSFSCQDITAYNLAVPKQQANDDNRLEEIIDAELEAAIKLSLTSPSSKLREGEPSSEEHALISMPQSLEAETKELKESENAELQAAIALSLTKSNEKNKDKKNSSKLNTPVAFSSQEKPPSNAILSTLVGDRTGSPLYNRSTSPPLETMKELTSQGQTQSDERECIKREIIKHIALIKELIEPRNMGENIVPSFLEEVVKPQLQFSEEMLAGEYDIRQWQERLVALKVCEAILKDCQKATTSIAMRII